MDESTALMLDAIDKRIAKLKQIRSLIVEEFGQPMNGSMPKPTRRTRKRISRSAGNARTGGRKAQIYDWLKQNGPATRAEVIKGTGLPPGTVGGYLSAEKELFENHSGKWQAR
jgi:hypothetical protein